MFQIDSDACWLSSCPGIVYWKDYFPPLNDLSTLVKNHLPISIQVYCWIILHWYMSMLIPISHCLDYSSFVVTFEVKVCKFSILFFFQIVLYVLVVSIDICILEPACQFLYVFLLLPRCQRGFWSWLRWFSRSIWGFGVGGTQSMSDSKLGTLLALFHCILQEPYDVVITMCILQMRAMRF